MGATDEGPATPGQLQLRRQLEREDRQRGMNALQLLLDDARYHPDGTVRLTQAQLATLTGMTRGRVQYVLRGQTRTAPPLEDLERLAAALGLELAQVQRAAGQVYGWNLYATTDQRIQRMVAKAGRLTDHQLDAVAALMDALAADDPPAAATA